ncbi:helix-turn-helix domain-containing protein [Streptomyces sp. NBRC 109706]|uniref:helix-turn-helix domain-containing protein n=1 Tax=Streptomyces sp. NBRC 109706 TaxID=1550035 RepID=UPI00099D5A96|nr:helix-turn-helix transcriptional regulator [Streptomyces sp. NBRC 109706]
MRPVPAPGAAPEPAPAPVTVREPLLRHVVGAALRRERLARGRTLKEVAERARISMPYLSEVERGRKEASSEVLAAAAQALGLGLAELLALTQAQLTDAHPATAPAPAAPAPAPEQPTDGRATSLLTHRTPRPQRPGDTADTMLLAA